MPNNDTLIESISQKISDPVSERTTDFSTLDLKYEYSQLKRHPETAKHCTFNIIRGEKTGTYRFHTGFYGHTDMPAELQKAMDYTLIGFKKTYCLLDEILIVSKGSEEKHKRYVFNCLKRLDEENLKIFLSKCHFVKLEIEWLGRNISQSGISPIKTKHQRSYPLKHRKH